MGDTAIDIRINIDYNEFLTRFGVENISECEHGIAAALAATTGLPRSDIEATLTEAED